MELLQYIREDVPFIGKLGKIDESVLERIFRYTTLPNFENIQDLKQQCWIWNGTRDKTYIKGHQHGSIWYNKKYVMVHRLMFHNFIENVPEYKRSSETLQVNHSCTHLNNGRCINPWHMYLGTPKENTKNSIDAGTKIRVASGEQNPNAKLTDAQIIEIKNLKGSGRSQTSIAIEYGINQSQVSRYWRNITRS